MSLKVTYSDASRVQFDQAIKDHRMNPKDIERTILEECSKIEKFSVSLLSQKFYLAMSKENYLLRIKVWSPGTSTELKVVEFSLSYFEASEANSFLVNGCRLATFVSCCQNPEVSSDRRKVLESEQFLKESSDEKLASDRVKIGQFVFFLTPELIGNLTYKPRNEHVTDVKVLLKCFKRMKGLKNCPDKNAEGPRPFFFNQNDTVILVSAYDYTDENGSAPLNDAVAFSVVTAYYPNDNYLKTRVGSDEVVKHWKSNIIPKIKP